MFTEESGIIKKIATIHVDIKRILYYFYADDTNKEFPWEKWFGDRVKYIQTARITRGSITLNDIFGVFKAHGMSIDDASMKRDTKIECPIFFECGLDDSYDGDLEISVYIAK